MIRLKLKKINVFFFCIKIKKIIYLKMILNLKGFLTNLQSIYAQYSTFERVIWQPIKEKLFYFVTRSVIPEKSYLRSCYLYSEMFHSIRYVNVKDSIHKIICCQLIDTSYITVLHVWIDLSINMILFCHFTSWSNLVQLFTKRANLILYFVFC